LATVHWLAQVHIIKLLWEYLGKYLMAMELWINWHLADPTHKQQWVNSIYMLNTFYKKEFPKQSFSKLGEVTQDVYISEDGQLAH